MLAYWVDTCRLSRQECKQGAHHAVMPLHIGYPALVQRRTTVRANIGEAVNDPLLVPVKDQALSQNFHAQRLVLYLV